jgi:hypothetical protein
MGGATDAAAAVSASSSAIDPKLQESHGTIWNSIPSRS